MLLYYFWIILITFVFVIAIKAIDIKNPIFFFREAIDMEGRLTGKFIVAEGRTGIQMSPTDFQTYHFFNYNTWNPRIARSLSLSLLG